MDKMFGCNLEFVREDDFVEYFIFPKLPEEMELVRDRTKAELDELRCTLTNVLDEVTAIVKRLTEERNYIWHKDEFQLQIRTSDAQERLLNDEVQAATSSSKRDGQAAGSTVALPPHLHGVTHYGDNIADEWFIVYLLAQVTHAISGSIARIVDSDGEFLLIEAADVLPQWANPDTCEQRVYLADGRLQLVQNSPSNTTKAMSVASALSKIRQNATLYAVAPQIQQCIDERLREFTAPSECEPFLHQQIVNLPLGVAALLKQRPALIAPAVRAICERDPIDMKACRTMRFFPPEQRVRTNVRFTRCLYAMLVHNNYMPERKIGWNLNCSDGANAATAEPYKEDLLGAKIASGFEILATQAAATGQEDGGVENDPAWRSYVRSLTARGYFRQLVEGCAEYQRLLDEAKSFFRASQERFRTAPLVGREILDLLQSSESTSAQLSRDVENNLQPSDSDDWLNISAEQLDAMMMQRYGPKTLYKSEGAINADEFASNLSQFLERESAYDGIDMANTMLDSDDDTHGEEDEDEEDNPTNKAQAAEAPGKSKLKKNRSMRKACKESPIHAKDEAELLPPPKAAAPPQRPARTKKSARGEEADDDDGGDPDTTHVRNFLDFVIPEDNWDSQSDMSGYGDDDEDDLERNIEAMTPGDAAANIDADIRAYMAQMDRELANTNVRKGTGDMPNGRKKNTPTGGAAGRAEEDDFDDIEDFEPININVHTLKHMMDSYKSQLGGTGPVSHLLTAMGVGMSVAAAANATDEAAKDLSESSV